MIKLQNVSFCGYASVFNIVDKHKEIIEKNAFLNTINNFGNKKVDLLLKHKQDKPVGKITLIQEDDYGLYVEGVVEECLDDGAEIIDCFENKKDLYLSIGFYSKKTTNIDNITHIQDVDLVEISFVEKPSNVNCKILNFNNYEKIIVDN